MVESIVMMSAETEKQLKAIAVKKGESVEQVSGAMLEKAVKDYCYRQRRNAQVWAQKKALADNYDRLKQLAEEFGLEFNEEIV
jgi:hypothetical protein